MIVRDVVYNIFSVDTLSQEQTKQKHAPALSGDGVEQVAAGDALHNDEHLGGGSQNVQKFDDVRVAVRPRHGANLKLDKLASAKGLREHSRVENLDSDALLRGEDSPGLDFDALGLLPGPPVGNEVLP